MYLSSLFLTLALSLTSTVVAVRGNPAPSANGNSLSHLLLAPRADCGPINGNCYDNGCDGDKSSDGLHCISGEYAGCPCGYGCNKNYVGPCEAFGCDGVNNNASLLLFETSQNYSTGKEIVKAVIRNPHLESVFSFVRSSTFQPMLHLFPNNPNPIPFIIVAVA
ncbi:hypothetical protein GGU11DRAFT_879684 [Lentinula aff. detonsa]|nr:hypothetical protein GGU11DRAFT_879684 [Lentinula aff. detonsa]